jgi:hypothetical protein
MCPKGAPCWHRGARSKPNPADETDLAPSLNQDECKGMGDFVGQDGLRPPSYDRRPPE